jgi:hypothetical protein
MQAHTQIGTDTDTDTDTHRHTDTQTHRHTATHTHREGIVNSSFDSSTCSLGTVGPLKRDPRQDPLLHK